MPFDRDSKVELAPAPESVANSHDAWFLEECKKIRRFLRSTEDFAQNWQTALAECESHKSERSLLGESIRALPSLSQMRNSIDSIAASSRLAIEENSGLRKLIVSLQQLVVRLNYECTLRQLALQLSIRLREFELRACAHVVAGVWVELQQVNSGVAARTKAARFLDNFLPSAENECKEFCRFASSVDPETIKRVKSTYIGRSRYTHKDGSGKEDQVLAHLLSLFRNAVKTSNYALKGVPRSLSAVTTTRGQRQVVNGLGLCD